MIQVKGRRAAVTKALFFAAVGVAMVILTAPSHAQSGYNTTPTNPSPAIPCPGGAARNMNGDCPVPGGLNGNGSNPITGSPMPTAPPPPATPARPQPPNPSMPH